MRVFQGLFCATGITSGDLVSGISISDNTFKSETLITHKSSEVDKFINKIIILNDISFGKNWEELRFNKRLVEKVKIDNDFSEILSKLIIVEGSLEIFTIKNELIFPNPFLKNYDFLCM